MRYRNLLIATALSVIIPAAVNSLQAQQNVALPHNNNNSANNNVVNVSNTVVMNSYTYTPVLYQRGTSSADMRLFPNPASNTATIYINSIKDQDNGEVVIYNTAGTQVYRNTLRTGNNNVDLGNFSNGMYVVKVFTRARDIYTRQLVVQK